MKSVAYYGKLGDIQYNEIETRLERGYTSRRTVTNDETPVYSAGDGRLFYYEPCFFSTLYKYRRYLVKDGRFVRAW